MDLPLDRQFLLFYFYFSFCIPKNKPNLFFSDALQLNGSCTYLEIEIETNLNESDTEAY